MGDLGHRRGGHGDRLVDAVGVLGEHPVRAAHEAGLHRPLHPLEQWRPVAGGVEQDDRLGDQPELVPGEHLGELVDRAEPAGQDDEPVGQLVEPRLALVHRRGHLDAGEPGVGHLGADQLLGDHSDHLPAGSQRGVGHQAHQADPTSAVDQPDATVGQGRAELLGECGERRRVADVGAAVDAQACRRFGWHRNRMAHAARNASRRSIAAGHSGGHFRPGQTRR